MCTIHQTHQTKLIFSDAGLLEYYVPSRDHVCLTIVECYNPKCLHSVAYNGKHLRLASPPISTLPNELLDEILARCAPIPGYEHEERDSYKQAYRLSLVNKRFNSRATPILYSYINLDQVISPSRRVLRLYHTLTSQPHLGVHVRELHLRFYEAGGRIELSDEHLDLAASFARSMPNVLRLQIVGCVGRLGLMELIRSLAQQMPRVEDFYLARLELRYWSMDEVASLLEFKCLKTLGLSGVNWSRHLRINPSVNEYPGTPDETKVYPTLKCLSRLDISDFGQSPAELRKFLEIPTALTHFSLHGLHWWSWNRHAWDLGKITSCLLRHKSTLISIELGGFRGHFALENRLNVRDWPALRILALHWACINFDGVTAAETLLAYNLEKITLDFGTGDQHSPSWDAVDERCAKWCEDLLLIAVTRPAKLKRLHIEFNPEPWFGEEPIEEEQIPKWPWDWLHHAAEVISKQDPQVKLTHSEPSIGREEYYRFCREGPEEYAPEGTSESHSDDAENGNENDDEQGIGVEPLMFGPLTRIEMMQRDQFEVYFRVALENLLD